MAGRPLPVALLAALASVAIAGCGGSSGAPPASNAQGPATLTVAVDELPQVLDPARAQTPAERSVAVAVHTPLLTFRRHGGSGAGTLVPALAGDLPELSEDQREYTFRLRPGLLYADGRLVRASDVERAIAHASTHAADAEVRAVLAGIRGPATADGESLRGVVSDDRTGEITVRLNQPDGRVPLVLAGPETAPLPRLPSASGQLRGETSTGPLRIARRSGERLELVSNPLRAPIAEVPEAGVSRLILTAAPASDGADDTLVMPDGADLWLAPPAGRADPQGTRLIAARSGAVTSVVVAPQGRLESRTPRRALAAAIDRRGIETESQGRLAAWCGLLPPFAVGAVVREPCPQSPSAPADELLAGRVIPVAVTTQTSVALREPVGAALRDLGASPRFREVADPAAALAAGEAELAMVRSAPLIPHPAGWLQPAAAVDRLIARELPELAAGPLTGTAGEWEEFERRAVDRALVLPLATGRVTALAGAAVDQGSVLLHPVLGLDLAALARR